MRLRRISCVLAVAGIVALAGCDVNLSSTARSAASQPSAASSAATRATGATGGTGATATTSAGLIAVHDPGHVTGTITGTCHYRDGGQLPDPRCTPGSFDPAVTQANIHQTICVSGYTKTVRPPEEETDRFKYDVAYPAYGTAKSEKTELDHLVSLELGGSNDAANLWPESPSTPNPKDKVENALHKAVCDGQVTLTAAQRAIARDWETAESTLGLSS